MWKKQNVPSSTASLRGFSKAEHCINSIWSRQRLFEHASLKSSDWLKHLGKNTNIVLCGSLSLFLFWFWEFDHQKIFAVCRYTLGGFFLANYDDSPAGVFDELVVIAGLIWSPPTSCAWAAKVLVNSKEACDHGRKEVGLPSQVARFSKRITAVSRKPKTKQSEFLNLIGMEGGFSDPGEQVNVQVTEIMGQASKDTCNVNLTTFVPALDINKWMGPAIKMSLPSFSGRTEYYPDLLKYSCQIDCRVRVVHPAKVSGPSPVPSNENENKQCSEIHSCNTQNQATKEFMDNEQNLTRAVMLSKPILALEFSSMKMQVEAPVVVSNYFKNSLATS
ncbi:protein NEOXANTHIN-DEFICIENT 1 isoform X3 [Rosa chinensis]|uniref:protein NEOXANTHIN-DEFICIENT 1 isoform X3 n=1 Tax=Rosa chinensis TaxID=74649 RepID=UPI001AD8C652|nr:protein NEOXANTHIN-DEFICIENT 1 isoform X3 [Rosa chinensis]